MQASMLQGMKLLLGTVGRPGVRYPPWSRWTSVLAVAIVLNFIVFVVVSLFIGGDAWNGHARDGQYFLASHGELTQVSKVIFLYSKYHVLSVMITWPLLMILGLWNWIGEKRRSGSPIFSRR